jgi:hypothetical protein
MNKLSKYHKMDLCMYMHNDRSTLLTIRSLSKSFKQVIHDLYTNQIAIQWTMRSGIVNPFLKIILKSYIERKIRKKDLVQVYHISNPGGISELIEYYKVKGLSQYELELILNSIYPKEDNIGNELSYKYCNLIKDHGNVELNRFEISRFCDVLHGVLILFDEPNNASIEFRSGGILMYKWRSPLYKSRFRFLNITKIFKDDETGFPMLRGMFHTQSVHFKCKYKFKYWIFGATINRNTEKLCKDEMYELKQNNQLLSKIGVFGFKYPYNKNDDVQKIYDSLIGHGVRPSKSQEQRVLFNLINMMNRIKKGTPFQLKCKEQIKQKKKQLNKKWIKDFFDANNIKPILPELFNKLNISESSTCNMSGRTFRWTRSYILIPSSLCTMYQCNCPKNYDINSNEPGKIWNDVCLIKYSNKHMLSEKNDSIMLSLYDNDIYPLIPTDHFTPLHI